MEYKCKSFYFEDFKIENKFSNADRKITENDIITFVGLSGDHYKIQTDIKFADKTIYKERIAHGLLEVSEICGLAARLSYSEETVIALREIQRKF